jgi:hypothetical protein
MVMLLAVCTAATLLLILEDRQGSGNRGADGSVPLLAIGDVTEFSIRDTTNRLSFIKRGQTWFVRHPLKSRAESGKIEQMLERLEGLQRMETITSEQRAHRGLALVDYGLVAPRLNIFVRHSLGLTELMVGNSSPLGDRLYVQLEGDSSVLSTSQGLLELVPGSVDTYRDRIVMRGSFAHTSRIELHRAGGSFVRAVRDQGVWRLQAPVKDWADSRQIELLLKALYGLQIEAFVWDPEPSDPETVERVGVDLPGDATPRVETYGLAADEASARVQVWQDGTLVNSEILFGKATGPEAATIYAKRREIESVYAVDERILDLLSVDVDTLRSHDIFRVAPAEVRYFSVQQGENELVIEKHGEGQWKIEEPAKWQADQQVVDDMILSLSKWRTEAFVDGDTSSNMTARLDPPHCIVRLTAPVREKGAEPELEASPVRGGQGGSVAIGRWQNNDTHVPLRVDGDETLRLVPVALVRALASNPTDALIYRQRRMLAIPPAGVKRITFAARDLSESITQDEAGLWLAADSTNVVNVAAVHDILFFVADMRADRIEALATNDLSKYGLDSPRSTLTFGLSGQAGIQKTLLLGSATAEDDGIYSMVQGQDVVFVLSAPLVDRLTAGLLEKE